MHNSAFLRSVWNDKSFILKNIGFTIKSGLMLIGMDKRILRFDWEYWIDSPLPLMIASVKPPENRSKRNLVDKG